MPSRVISPIKKRRRSATGNNKDSTTRPRVTSSGEPASPCSRPSSPSSSSSPCRSSPPKSGRAHLVNCLLTDVGLTIIGYLDGSEVGRCSLLCRDARALSTRFKHCSSLSLGYAADVATLSLFSNTTTLTIATERLAIDDINNLVTLAPTLHHIIFQGLQRLRPQHPKWMALFALLRACRALKVLDLPVGPGWENHSDLLFHFTLDGLRTNAWPQLEQLQISCASVMENHLQLLGEAFLEVDTAVLPKLKKLVLDVETHGEEELYYDSIDYPALVEVFQSGRLSSLTSIELLGAECYDGDLVPLLDSLSSSVCPHLTSVYIHFNMGPMTAAAATGALTRLNTSALEDVSLWLRGVTEQSVTPFYDLLTTTGLPSLRSLSIPFVCTEAASSTAVNAVIVAISSSRLPSLNALDLAYRDVGGETFTNLLDALAKYSPGLTSLNLRHNPIDHTGAATLRDYLLSGCFPRLQNLILDGTQLGEAGVRCLAEAISGKGLSCLTTFNLADVRIGRAGLEALAKAWSNVPAPRLRNLALCGGRYYRDGLRERREGVESLLRALEVGCLSGLKELTIQGIGGWELATTRKALAQACEQRQVELKLVEY